MGFHFSLESFHQSRQDDRILDISFPSSEIESLKPRTTIITHRVSDDAEKFNKGDLVYAEAIDDNYCFEIVDQKIISKIENSPYYKDLTGWQRTYLSKFDKISVLTLKKSKYERPYKLSTIKAKYPEKVYKMLVADACHAWRARTGIELIHKEPDKTEQNRIWKNWNLMPVKYKKISDEKCVQLFGVGNSEHNDIVQKEKAYTSDQDPALKYVVSRYKSLFNVDVSWIKLIETSRMRTPDGKIDTEYKSNVFGGYCIRASDDIYINSDSSLLTKIYTKSFGVVVSSASDLRKRILAHELAHRIANRELLGKGVVTKYIKYARDTLFTSPYLEWLKKNQPSVYGHGSEIFAEFLTAIVMGDINNITV